MPTPESGENKSGFLKRCIPMLIKDENRPQKQAIAICINMFERFEKKQGNVSLEETMELLAAYDELMNEADLNIQIPNLSDISPELGTAVSIYKQLKKDKEQKQANQFSTIPKPLKRLNQTDISKLVKPSTTKLVKFDDRSVNNKIIKPQGIIVCDTVNNPFFPIDVPIIDNAKFSLPDIKKRFQAYYTSLPVDFLPWHYVAEMINGKYYFFQTRPIDMCFPLDNIECKDLLQANKDILTLSPSTTTFFSNQPFDIKNSIHVCIVGDTNSDVYIDLLYEMIGRICIGPILRYFKLPSSINLRVINLNLGNKFNFAKLEQYTKR